MSIQDFAPSSQEEDYLFTSLVYYYAFNNDAGNTKGFEKKDNKAEKKYKKHHRRNCWRVTNSSGRDPPEDCHEDLFYWQQFSTEKMKGPRN